MAPGRHSKPGRGKRAPSTPRQRMIEMVDAGTSTTHLLTADAAAAGWAAKGRYLALCGAPVVPAALVDPGRNCCGSCLGRDVRWYRRSTADHDTHRGALARGSLDAACGIRFRPQWVGFARRALRDRPTDDRVCPRCEMS